MGHCPPGAAVIVLSPESRSPLNLAKSDIKVHTVTKVMVIMVDMVTIVNRVTVVNIVIMSSMVTMDPLDLAKLGQAVVCPANLQRLWNLANKPNGFMYQTFYSNLMH